MDDARSFTVGKLLWTRQVAGDAALPPQATRLAVVLAVDFLNAKTRDAWPSIATLAKRLGVAPNTVRAALAAMEARGHIAVSIGGGRSATNRYRPILTSDSASENTSEDCAVSDAKPTRKLKGMKKETLQSADENPSISCAKPSKFFTETVQFSGGEPYEEHEEEPFDRTLSATTEHITSATPFAATGEILDPVADMFSDFLTAFPRREGKTSAFAAWKKVIEAGAAPERIILAAERYAAAVQGREPRYVKLPANWLNERLFDEEPPAPQGPARASEDAFLEAFADSWRRQANA